MAGPNVLDCGNPAATISSPPPGVLVRSVITVYGTASIPQFNFYKIEVRPENSDGVWMNAVSSGTPVVNGVLGRIDTTQFSEGVYWLQLTVVDLTSSYPPPCRIRLVFAR